MTTAALQRITPLLYVDTIEPSLPFWRDALGFSLTIQVPHGDGLGFAALEKDGLEIMLQTIASLRHDAPTLADAYRGDKTWLFIEVDDIEAIEAALTGHPVCLARRKTGYGATEIGFDEPGGHHVVFAQFSR
ncbi:VOC family protein [Tahibacter amnicola]|uniref:VOC family protein n=1 Tax=Tahibacter amnicola TaxID=2976241 RepID=A0ABY6BHT3_9GAMM|nr:VOC family protein [Tahibacter amnicola]UXI69563.1 VOC family protein [Tahibacter amnicola]